MFYLFCSRFVIVKTFAKVRNMKSDIIDMLFNLQTKDKVDLSIENIYELTLSHAEKCMVAVCSKTCTFFDVSSDNILLNYNVELNSETDFVTSHFDLDDALLILINQSGLVFAYNVNDKKLLWSIPLSSDKSSNLDFHLFTFHFTSNGKIICRGVSASDSHKLYILDSTNGNILTCCDGEKYPLNIIAIHKSEKWIAAASTTDTLIDNVKSKPIFIWDIETGSTVNKIKGNKGSFKSVTFIGDNDEYIAFSRQ